MRNLFLILLVGIVLLLSSCGSNNQQPNKESPQSIQRSQQVDDWASNASVATREFTKSEGMVNSSISEFTAGKIDIKTFINQLGSAQVTLNHGIYDIYGSKLDDSNAAQINQELITSFNDYYTAIKHLQQGTMIQNETWANSALQEIKSAQNEEKNATEDFKSYMGN